jgi:hypothetical protein
VAISGVDVIEGPASVGCPTGAAFEDGPTAQVGQGIEQDVDPEFEIARRHVRDSERPEPGLAHLIGQLGEAIDGASRAGVFAVGA